MKKFIIILLNVIFILSSTISVNAANDVSFTMTDVECNNNRLFTVDVKAKSADRFSVATFEFVYDRSVIDFRKVSCDDNSLVRVHDNGESVVVSYLCTDGINIEDYTTIFTLKFKSISVGETKINYTVSNCVNSDVEDMPIGSCTSSVINVKSKSTNNKISQTKKNNSSKSSSDKIETTTYEYATIDELGDLNPDQFNNNKVVILTIAAFSSVAVAAFLLGRLFTKKESKIEKDKTIDTEEDLS